MPVHNPDFYIGKPKSTTTTITTTLQQGKQKLNTITKTLLEGKQKITNYLNNIEWVTDDGSTYNNTHSSNNSNNNRNTNSNSNSDNLSNINKQQDFFS